MRAKPIVSILAMLSAAALLAAVVPGVASAGLQPAGIVYPGGTTGGTFAVEPAAFLDGQKVKLVGNFPNSSSGQMVSFYKETSPGSGDYDKVAEDDANANGNAYIVDYVVNGAQKMFAETSGGKITQVQSLKPIDLGSCTETGSFTTNPSPVAAGQDVELFANFATSASGREVVFFRKVGSELEVIGVDDAANKNGNAYLDHQVADGPETFTALIPSTDQCTPEATIEPVPSSAVLHPIQLDTDGHDAKATFSPIQQGTKTELQVKTLKDKTWKTISTDTQRKSGHTYFQIKDPLEMEHEYRARMGGMVTNVVTFAAPLQNRGNGLPTVHFNSRDGESVNTRDKWFKGELVIQEGTADQNKNLELETCDAVGPFEAEMKGRGNYSWSFDKKGFNLKLPKRDDDKIYDLCGMGKSRKWALVANHYDRSLLRNSAANFIGKQMDFLEYTPKDVQVDLFVNGSYRGAYILIERVNFEGGRLDEEELKSDDDTADFCFDDNHPELSGSYLMEWDFRKGAFYNISAGQRGWVGLKEPEDEDYCSAMGRWINRHLDKVDADLFDGSASGDDWLDHIDIASAADYFIAMEFLKPVDGQMWASVYMYKPRDGKIKFGPLWDFDLAMGSATRAGNVASPQGWYLRNPINVSAKQTDKTWFNRMNENPTFRAAVKKRWNEVDQDINDVIDYLKQQKSLISKAASDNYTKWDHGTKISKYQVVKSSWSKDVDHLIDWLDQRWYWMNGQLDNDD